MFINDAASLAASFDDFVVISLGEAVHVVVALLVVIAFSKLLGRHKRPLKQAKVPKDPGGHAPTPKAAPPQTVAPTPPARPRAAAPPRVGAAVVIRSEAKEPPSSSCTAHPRQQGERDKETQNLAAAVRTGRAEDLSSLLDAGRARAMARGAGAESVQDRTIVLLLAALRACAAHRFFAEGIQAYDHVAKWVGAGRMHMWSLLLYSAVEAGQFRRCQFFFARLRLLGTPASHDYISMVRCQTYRRNMPGLKQIFEEMQGHGHKLPQITRNRALQLCVAKLDFVFAERLAAEAACERAMDAAGYATLMRGFLKAGLPLRCLGLYAQMRAGGLEPNEKIAGVLLEACADAGQPKRAAKVVQELQSFGVEVHRGQFVELMRRLGSIGRIDCVTEVLEALQARAAEVTPEDVDTSDASPGSSPM